MASHTSRHTGKNSFSTQDEHWVLLGLEALTDTPNFRSATRSIYGKQPSRLFSWKYGKIFLQRPGLWYGSAALNRGEAHL